jgi:hypothetical protein
MAREHHGSRIQACGSLYGTTAKLVSMDNIEAAERFACQVPPGRNFVATFPESIREHGLGCEPDRGAVSCRLIEDSSDDADLHRGPGCMARRRVRLAKINWMD